MRMECCGKTINTPFCPICGKAIGSAGSLLSHLQAELKRTHDKKERCERRLRPDYEFYKKREQGRNESNLKTILAKIDRLNSWIKWVMERSE